MSAEEAESKSGASEGEEEVDHNDLTNSDIVAKYRFAADVANRECRGCGGAARRPRVARQTPRGRLCAGPGRNSAFRGTCPWLPAPVRS